MNKITLVTYDWAPEFAQGYVRDVRVRWALAEAGLPYSVETTSLQNKSDAHFAAQPFGQVPWLRDGDVSIFESGAILLHLAEKNSMLMPAKGQARADALQWTLAALNSVETASLPWQIFLFNNLDQSSQGFEKIKQFLDGRLGHMEPVLAAREWLAGSFSVADILMADVLRTINRFEGLEQFPACKGYVARATNRPSFQKALDAQLAHFAPASSS